MYNSSKFNLGAKIRKDKKERSSESVPAIDFPQTIDQHSNRIDSWRSYNSGLDGHEGGKLTKYFVGKGCCGVVCCCCNSYARYRAQYYTWPIWWLLYHLSCCCLCGSKGSEVPLNKMQQMKKKLKHLKRRKVNEDLKTIYALI